MSDSRTQEQSQRQLKRRRRRDIHSCGYYGIGRHRGDTQSTPVAGRRLSGRGEGSTMAYSAVSSNGCRERCQDSNRDRMGGRSGNVDKSLEANHPGTSCIRGCNADPQHQHACHQATYSMRPFDDRGHQAALALYTGSWGEVEHSHRRIVGQTSSRTGSCATLLADAHVVHGLFDA